MPKDTHIKDVNLEILVEYQLEAKRHLVSLTKDLLDKETSVAQLEEEIDKIGAVYNDPKGLHALGIKPQS